MRELTQYKNWLDTANAQLLEFSHFAQDVNTLAGLQQSPGWVPKLNMALEPQLTSLFAEVKTAVRERTDLRQRVQLLETMLRRLGTATLVGSTDGEYADICAEVRRLVEKDRRPRKHASLTEILKEQQRADDILQRISHNDQGTATQPDNCVVAPARVDWQLQMPGMPLDNEDPIA